MLIKIVISSVRQFYLKIKDLSNTVEAVYFIGPESDNVLEKLVKTPIATNVKSLNSEVDGIEVGSNKRIVYEIARKIGLKVPETEIIEIDESFENIRKKIKDIGYPSIIKPIMGVSCDGLSVVKIQSHLHDAIKKVSKESTSKYFIAQKLIRGHSASVSVLSTGVEAVSVSLNKQFVNLEDPHHE
ncbi:MAG: ATP-grasp domain-containing protein [Candidatus Bathyarchaeota archaeon]